MPRAEVDRFAVQNRGGLAVVSWETSLEQGLRHFLLRRGNREAPGDLVAQVAVGDNELGGTYEADDPAAAPGSLVSYAIFADTHSGGTIWIADRQVRVPARPAVQTAVAALAAPAQVVSLGGATWIGSSDRVKAWTEETPADRVRLSVRVDGVYRVTVSELASAFGLSFDEIATALAEGLFTLSSGGVEVAWEASGDSLRFYGLAPISSYAPENVYWLTPAAGLRMLARDAAPPADAVPNAHFTSGIRVQGTAHKTRVGFGTLTEFPYVGFQSLKGTTTGSAVSTALPDPAPGVWSGQVTVELISNFNVGIDNHTNRVVVGGVEIGRNGWSGEAFSSRAYPFDSARISGGALSVRVDSLDATGSNNGLFIWLAHRIEYQRLFRAVNGQLRCTGGPSNSVSVAAFGDADISAWNISNPLLPEVLTNTQVTAAGSGQWQVTFADSGTNADYAVFSRSSGCYAPAVRGVRDVDWSASSHSADYVMLVPPEGWIGGFRQALQPLADYRERQGLVTRIVDVESVYNRYSHGLVHPQAIRDFVTEAYTRWQPRRLRYLLLAGQGNVDFNHTALGLSPSMSYSACLIPTFIVPQAFYFYSAGVLVGGEGMTAAIDARLGDAGGGIAPEVAVGRLPVVTTQQLALVVSKTIDFERSAGWRRRAAVSADYSLNTDLVFTNETERLIPPLLNQGREVTRVYPVYNTPGYSLWYEWRDILKPALADGCGLFHYFGHSGQQSLGYNTASDKALLNHTRVTPANWTRPPIATLMGCHIGRWHTPSITVPLASVGLLASGSGFAAAVASTAYVGDRDGADYGAFFYQLAASRRTLRLGDAWRDGLAAMEAKGVAGERYLCLSLIGDPALVLRHDASGFADGSVIVVY